MRTMTTLIACCVLALTSSAAFAKESTVPGNTSPKDSGTGKSAGFEGGAGAAGLSGTDPATLKRTEEQRVQQKNAGKGSAGDGKRKDWKD